MHNFHRKHKYIDVEDMELSEKINTKITNDLQNMCEKPFGSQKEITKLMNESFGGTTEKRNFNKNINFWIYDLGILIFKI